MNLGTETKLKFWVQVLHGDDWITIPGFSGEDWHEVRKGAETLRGLNQDVRIIREVVRSTLDIIG